MIVFHVAISLASLGICYLIVSSGIDVLPYVEKLPLVGDQLKSNALAAGASTFVIAYGERENEPNFCLLLSTLLMMHLNALFQLSTKSSRLFVSASH